MPIPKLNAIIKAKEDLIKEAKKEMEERNGKNGAYDPNLIQELLENSRND